MLRIAPVEMTLEGRPKLESVLQSDWRLAATPLRQAQPSGSVVTYGWTFESFSIP
jgi:hypothetical protein